MKNSICLPSLALLLLAACGGTENAGDKLSADELKYLRTKSISQCKSEVDADYLRYLVDSNGMFTSSSFVRNKTWKYEFKGDTAVLETHKLTVWKQNATNIYFIDVVTPVGQPNRFQFLKINKTTNQAMLTELLTQYCNAKADPTTVANATLSDTAIWYQVITRTNYSTTQDQKTTASYNYSSTLPAYFSFFRSTQQVDTINNETETVASTTKSSRTLTVLADEAPVNTVYSAYPAGVTTFCVPKEENVPPAVFKYKLPYDLNCQPEASSPFPVNEL